jgi:hypothetical protein
MNVLKESNESLKECISKEVNQGKRFSLDRSKKPYIRKIEQIAGFNVWLVDGDYIRKNISEDFVNYDQHYHLNFIPENEFWIDEENIHNEHRYYVDHLLTENRLMRTGLSYEKAYEKAAVVERKERSKSVIMRKLFRRKRHRRELLDRVHEKLLKKYSVNLRTWIVDGELVRDLFFLDFAGGGHGKVYHFIPEDEIWIDDDMSQRERRFIILHEMHERNLMLRGMDYPSAHRSATEIEDLCRHHPETLGRALKEEMGVPGPAVRGRNSSNENRN